MLMPATAMEIASGFVMRPDTQTILSLVYVVLIATILAYICFNRGVELIGPNRAGPFFHLIPVVRSLLAIVFLGEAFRIYHAVGYALILSGIFLAQRFSRRAEWRGAAMAWQQTGSEAGAYPSRRPCEASLGGDRRNRLTWQVRVAPPSLPSSLPARPAIHAVMSTRGKRWFGTSIRPHSSPKHHGMDPGSEPGMTGKVQENTTRYHFRARNDGGRRKTASRRMGRLRCTRPSPRPPQETSVPPARNPLDHDPRTTPDHDNDAPARNSVRLPDVAGQLGDAHRPFHPVGRGRSSSPRSRWPRSRRWRSCSCASCSARSPASGAAAERPCLPGHGFRLHALPRHGAHQQRGALRLLTWGQTEIASGLAAILNAFTPISTVIICTSSPPPTGRPR